MEASTHMIEPYSGLMAPSVQVTRSLPLDVTAMDATDPGVFGTMEFPAPRSIILCTQISSPVEASNAWTYPS